MATFKFLVLPHQRKEDGTYNVKIRITQKGKSKYIKTSHNVSASDIINNGKEKIKIKNQAVIDLMEEMILGFKKKLTSAGVEAEHWDVDRIVEYLTTEEKNFSLNFISYGRKIADDLEQDGRLGTAKNYRIAINALVRFIGKEELDINLITASFMRAFEKFLKNEPSFKMVDQNLLISLKVNGAYLFTHHKSKHYTTSLKMNIMTRTEESYASHFPRSQNTKSHQFPKVSIEHCL